MLLEKLKTSKRNRKGLAFILTFIVMISILTMGAIFDMETTSVTLVQRDVFSGTESREEFATSAKTVEAFLTEQNITLGEDDVLDVDMSSEIHSDQVITLEKSRFIEINVDGKMSFERTMERTVGEALNASGVTLSENDIVEPGKDTVITPNMTITVSRRGFEENIVETEIPFETVEENDATILVGDTRVKQAGAAGVKRETYKVEKINGEEVSRELVASEVIKEPIKRIVLKGTKQKETVVEKKKDIVNENVAFNKAKKEKEEKVKAEKEKAAKAQANAASSNSKISEKGFSYTKVLTVDATAYDPSLGGRKKPGETRTASGMICRRGVIAVDPNVIPMGTKLYVESADGGKSWVYGYCVAGDKGSGIKGLKVDLCFDTYAECKKFGRRTATVYILE